MLCSISILSPAVLLVNHSKSQHIIKQKTVSNFSILNQDKNTVVGKYSIPLQPVKNNVLKNKIDLFTVFMDAQEDNPASPRYFGRNNQMFGGSRYGGLAGSYADQGDIEMFLPPEPWVPPVLPQGYNLTDMLSKIQYAKKLLQISSDSVQTSIDSVGELTSILSKLGIGLSFILPVAPIAFGLSILADTFTTFREELLKVKSVLSDGINSLNSVIDKTSVAIESKLAGLIKNVLLNE